MRIGSLADAAGTTPRTVRHYHRLGLLSEPRRLSNGYREYTIDDVIRLMRIRWLAECGMPLGAIAAVLDGKATDEPDVVGDLRALLAGIETEQTALAHKHSRLSALLDDAVERRPLTTLPRDVAATFGSLLDAADERDRPALIRERDLLEVMAISGRVPAAFFETMSAALGDHDLRRRYLVLLRRFGALEGRSVAESEHDIDALADELVSVLDVESFAQAPESAALGSDSTGLLDIEDIVPDAAQRAVVLRTTTRLLDGAHPAGTSQ